jgi:hypothetical protein
MGLGTGSPTKRPKPFSARKMRKNGSSHNFVIKYLLQTVSFLVFQTFSELARARDRYFFEEKITVRILDVPSC